MAGVLGFAVFADSSFGLSPLFCSLALARFVGSGFDYGGPFLIELADALPFDVDTCILVAVDEPAAVRTNPFLSWPSFSSPKYPPQKLQVLLEGYHLSTKMAAAVHGPIWFRLHDTSASYLKKGNLRRFR